MQFILINIVTKELYDVWHSRAAINSLFSQANHRINAKKQSILDPDSDDAIDIANDLTLCQIILEKIADNPEA